MMGNKKAVFGDIKQINIDKQERALRTFNRELQELTLRTSHVDAADLGHVAYLAFNKAFEDADIQEWLDFQNGLSGRSN